VVLFNAVMLLDGLKNEKAYSFRGRPARTESILR
jgi:hypothetical protein